jgi:phenylpropionate dioxygenase-like ring-hydroxylating dioxygenase large terminal subunit
MNAPTVFGAPVRWPAKINEIPKDIFDREDVFRMELERIFYGPEWHPVAHTGEIPNVGDFKTFHIGERPLLVVHGQDGQIRVFYNACSHRGTLLETNNRGNKTEFECPYHRWLFDSTGALRGCPGKEDFSPSFTMEDSGLAQVRSAIVGGLIFATLHDATPDIDTWLGRTQPALLQLLGGDGRLKLLGYQKVSYDCNWKAYVDNDGYHAPLLHLAFKLMGWQGGKGEQIVTENGHLAFDSELTIPSRIEALEDSSIVQFKGDPDSKGSIVVSTFPITVFTKHMDMLNIRYAFPKGPRGVEVHYTYFARDDDSPELLAHRTRQSANLLGPSGLISLEDAAIFTRIDLGNRSPGNAIFQKGVTDEYKLEFNVKQNDESGNLPRWEHYRKRMGFRRAKA